MLNKILLTIVCLFACVVLSNAHPLGNFSVNNFSRITAEKEGMRLFCVVDMAEIPTFQESQKIDADKNGTLDRAELGAYIERITPQYISNLQLSIDEKAVALQAESKEIFVVPGAGNLPTLRAVWHLTTKTAGAGDAVSRVRFENNNFKERVGWNEIVVNRAPGVNVFNSDAFGNAVTDELKNYPEDMLSAPLAERTAEFSFTTAAAPANATALQNRNGTANAPIQKDKFAELISVPQITPAIASAVWNLSATSRRRAP